MRKKRIDEMARLCATMLDSEGLRFAATVYESPDYAPHQLRDVDLTEHERRYVANRFRAIADEREAK